MGEPKQSVDGDANIQIGRDGEISQTTNIFQGVDAEKHAKALARIEILEDKDDYSDSGPLRDNIPKEDHEEIESSHLRGRKIYAFTVGILRSPTTFSFWILVLSIVTFIGYGESFPIVTEGEIIDCFDGVIEPGEIDPYFEGMTCQELSTYKENSEDWGVDDWLFLSSIGMFLTGVIVLWRPAWNPFLMLDNKVSLLEKPYKTMGIWLLLVSLLNLIVTLSFWDENIDTRMQNLFFNFMTYCCMVTIFLGIYCLFIYASREEQEVVRLEK